MVYEFTSVRSSLFYFLGGESGPNFTPSHMMGHNWATYHSLFWYFICGAIHRVSYFLRHGLLFRGASRSRFSYRSLLGPDTLEDLAARCVFLTGANFARFGGCRVSACQFISRHRARRTYFFTPLPYPRWFMLRQFYLCYICIHILQFIC